MPDAYLTIDDSPTKHTDAFTDWLIEHNMPAVLFCIGSAYEDLHLKCEGIEQNPGPIRRAIEKGFVIGNHTYTHPRFSDLSYDQMVEEVEETERLIDQLYKETKTPRPAKLIRFPHIDRGCGGWVIDFDSAAQYKAELKDLFWKGLNVKIDLPSHEQIEKKERFQEYLAKEGFSADCFSGVTFDWYSDTEMSDARDSLYTYSTSDWMVNPDFSEYSKNWAYKSVPDLKKKIDDDPWLHRNDSKHIILAHDHNNLMENTTELLHHMQSSNINFISII